MSSAISPFYYLGGNVTVPNFQALTLPLLQFAADGAEHSMPEAREAVARALSLNEDELREMLPSGRQTTFTNRTSWAKVYLAEAGLLENTRRGYFKISDRGMQVVQHPPAMITVKFLEQFPQFQNFRDRRRGDRSDKAALAIEERLETPREALELAAESMRLELAHQLMQQIKQSPPSFFERLVVELLVKMGYGGSIKDAGQAIGQSGDEGIDGIIKEDKLGLDLIYIQAKRWNSSAIGRPELQKFVGALHGQRAKKGVFITTSHFTQQAIEYVKQIDPNIVLIDGERLVELMIDANLGVSVESSIEIKKLDVDYFVED